MKRFSMTALFLAVFLFSLFISSCKSYQPAFNLENFYSDYNDKVDFVDSDSYTVLLPKNADPLYTHEAGIIFYPGGLVEYQSYFPLLIKCAEKGIACYIVEMPLNFAFMDKKAGEKILSLHPEIKHWYMAGHSLGGAIAASFLSSHINDFDGLILLAAYTTHDISDSGLQVLSIYGSNDGVLQMDNYQKNKENLPPVGKGFTEIIIDGGNHAGFASYGPQEGDGEADISTEEQQAKTADEICSWIFKSQEKR